jgi:hypothetical protein
MRTVLLPPGGNPTAVNKYIISYHGFNYAYIKETDRSKYPVEFKKGMGKDEKTYLRGYHASGLVNNIPIFTAAATLLALADLEHRYDMFLQNITIYH